MKTTFLPTAMLLLAFSSGVFAADEMMTKDGCKMMPRKEPAPEPTCCCQKAMTMAKPEAATKAGDNLDALVDKMKAAKGDEVLDAFAAVLNKILAERKAAQDKTSEGAPSSSAPAEHHH
jgi:hypothetical protein